MDEQKEKLEKEIRALFKPKPRLTPITEDNSSILNNCWTTKLYGDNGESLSPFSGKQVSGATFHFSSLIWPGFHLFFKDGEYFSVYIGDGLKYDPKGYYPVFEHNVDNDNDDPKLSFEFQAPAKKQEETKPAEE